MIGQIISFLINIFKHHKIKIFLISLSFSLSLVLFFPYSDLTLIFKSEINEVIKPNSLEMRKMDLNIFPSLSAELEGIKVHTRQTSIPIEHIGIQPQILSFLKLKPALDIYIKGLFSGEQKISVQVLNQQTFGLNWLFQIRFLDLFEALKIPAVLEGDIKGAFRGTFDSLERTISDGSLQIKTPKKPSQINFLGSQLGERIFPGLQLPNLIFSKIEIEALINSPSLVFKKVTLGTPKDSMFIQARGKFKIDLKTSQVSNYTSEVYIQVKKGVSSRFPVLGLLEPYKSSSNSGGDEIYQLEIKGTSLQGTPKIKKLSQF